MNTSPLHPETWFGLSLHSSCACFHRPCEFTCVTALGSLLFVLWTRQFPFPHSLLLVFTIIYPFHKGASVIGAGVVTEMSHIGMTTLKYCSLHLDHLLASVLISTLRKMELLSLQNMTLLLKRAYTSHRTQQYQYLSIPILIWKLYPSWLAFIVPDGDDVHYQKTEGIVLLSTELYGVE